MSQTTENQFSVLTQQIFQAILNQKQVKNILIEREFELAGLSRKHRVDLYWKFDYKGNVNPTVVETKAWDRPVNREALVQFKTVLDDLPEHLRGVFVTQTGYDAAAKQFAIQNGISLYELRKPTAKDKEGRIMTFHLRIHAFFPNSTNVEPIFDQSWAVAERERRGFGPNEILEISAGGREDQLFLLNEAGEKTGTFHSVIQSMFPKDYVELPPTVKEHRFTEPTYLATGNARFPRTKLLGIRATISLKRVDQEIILGGENFIDFILRDAISENTLLINRKDNRAEAKALPLIQKGRIRVRMERSFAEFSEQDKQKFLTDISRISGCPVNEIENVSFRQGCVIFEGELDREAVLRLVALFHKRNETIDGARDLDEFRLLLKAHGIGDVTDLDSFRFNVTVAKKSDDRKLVFVHGWRGDSTSFGVLPEFLSSEFRCESLIYEYPTGLWEKSPSIEFIGRNLDNWIRNHAGDTAKLAIISHSMGGVVTRKFIINQIIADKPLDKNVKQMTFVASPHTGTGLADLVRKVPIFRHVQTDEIGPNSSFLFNVNSQWKYWAAKNVPQNCTARCIFGTDDGVVPVNSAADLDKDSIPIANADHTAIIKPTTKDDEIVKTIARLIRESSF